MADARMIIPLSDISRTNLHQIRATTVGNSHHDPQTNLETTSTLLGRAKFTRQTTSTFRNGGRD